MLFFVGLGLYDERDISVKGLDAVRNADRVYAEFYTSRLMGVSLEEMERFYGTKITLLSRGEVEGDPTWLQEAGEKDLALLVGGDPMISTTHLDLRLRAIELGIPTRVIHSSTIASAIPGLTGLQNYRFGRSTSIPFAYSVRGKRVVPQTPYQVVRENLGANLHSMLYLDIQDGRYMTVNQGIEQLLEIEESLGGGDLASALGVGVARAGSDQTLVRADRLQRLKEVDFDGPLHTLVIPARLHFMEARALMVLAGAPADAVREAEI